MNGRSGRSVRVEILESPEEVARRAHELVCSALVAARRAERTPVLGLASGSSMKLLYARVAAEARALAMPVDDLSLVALDEYAGIDPSGPGSFRDQLLRRVVFAWGMEPGRLLMPPAAEPTTEALAAFEEAIGALGGVDLQLLGIGANGHIAFNEPGTPWDSRTRLVTLAESTRAANSDGFPGRVPEQAVTQGIATILGARALLLLATGAHKAEAVAAALGAPRVDCPASVLQNHPDATMLLDPEAASRLPGRFRR